MDLFTSSFHVLMLCSRFRPEGNSKVLKEFHAGSAWLLINQTQRAWPALSRDFTCRSTCTLHILLPWFTDLNSSSLVWALNKIYPYTGLSSWINCYLGFFRGSITEARWYSKFPWLWTGVFIKIYNLKWLHIMSVCALLKIFKNDTCP